MSGLADFIVKVYDRFLLLDLLSYVTPGLIIIMAKCGKIDFEKCKFSFDFNFGEGIILFLFAFVIGLAINEIANLIVPDIYCKDEQKIRNRICKAEENRKYFYEQMINILRIGHKKYNNFKNNYISKRERYVIIKQMARNNGVSFIIASIIISFHKFDIGILVAGIFIGLLLLFASHRTLENQKDFEKVVLKIEER